MLYENADDRVPGTTLPSTFFTDVRRRLSIASRVYRAHLYRRPFHNRTPARQRSRWPAGRRPVQRVYIYCARLFLIELYYLICFDTSLFIHIDSRRPLRSVYRQSSTSRPSVRSFVRPSVGSFVRPVYPSVSPFDPSVRPSRPSVRPIHLVRPYCPSFHTSVHPSCPSVRRICTSYY